MEAGFACQGKRQPLPLGRAASDATVHPALVSPSGENIPRPAEKKRKKARKGRKGRGYNITSGAPFGRRITTVPAILSCQPCFSRSQTIQRKPRKKTTMENAAASARTIETTKEI